MGPMLEASSQAACSQLAVGFFVRQVGRGRLKALAHFDLSDRPEKNIWLWRKTLTQGKSGPHPSPARAERSTVAVCML